MTESVSQNGGVEYLKQVKEKIRQDEIRKVEDRIKELEKQLQEEKLKVMKLKESEIPDELVHSKTKEEFWANWMKEFSKESARAKAKQLPACVISMRCKCGKNVKFIFRYSDKYKCYFCEECQEVYKIDSKVATQVIRPGVK